MQTIIGVFNNTTDARDATVMLEKMGYSPHEISINTAMVEQSIGIKGGTTRHSPSGAAHGIVVGGIAGLLLGVAVVNLPGMDAFSASNPLTSELGLSGIAEVIVTSTILGAVVGFFLGAILGLSTHRTSVPYQQQYMGQAQQYMGQAVVLAVPAALGDHADYVRDVLEQHHAGQIRSVTS